MDFKKLRKILLITLVIVLVVFGLVSVFTPKKVVA